MSTADALLCFGEWTNWQMSEEQSLRFLRAHAFNVESAVDAFCSGGLGVALGSTTPATQQQPAKRPKLEAKPKVASPIAPKDFFNTASTSTTVAAASSTAANPANGSAEPGWYVLLKGQLEPYECEASLILEWAHWSLAERVSVPVKGQIFEVQFRGGGEVVQCGKDKERTVRRIAAADGAPIPRLSAARDIATLVDVPSIDALYQEPLLAVSQTVEALRRAVEAGLADWQRAAVALKPLEGMNVALAGKTALGRGVLHRLIVEGGGKTPTKDATGAKTVNRNTNVVVIGLFRGEAESREAEQQAALLNEERHGGGGSGSGSEGGGSSSSSAGGGGGSGSKGKGKAPPKPPIVCYTEAELVQHLTAANSAEGIGSGFPRLMHELAEAVKTLHRRRLLLDLAFASSAWVAHMATRPLRGVQVAFTGVFLLSRGVLTGGDTHTDAAELVRRCGGIVVDHVTKSSTQLLVAGRGEKGENGRENRRQEAVESSGKWRRAKQYGICIVCEEELLGLLLSEEAGQLVEAAEVAAATWRPRQITSVTAAPVHLPDLRAIRFTSVAQRAHGMGEPGAKGAVLADALAAPTGTSLAAAVVAGQSLNENFVWTMLQTASCADGSGERPGAEGAEW